MTNESEADPDFHRFFAVAKNTSFPEAEEYPDFDSEISSSQKLNPICDPAFSGNLSDFFLGSQ